MLAGANEPAAQAEQLEALASDHEPGVQIVQLEDPAAMKDPAAQGAQLDAPNEPLKEVVPAGHGKHEPPMVGETSANEPAGHASSGAFTTPTPRHSEKGGSAAVGYSLGMHVMVHEPRKEKRPVRVVKKKSASLGESAMPVG